MKTPALLLASVLLLGIFHPAYAEDAAPSAPAAPVIIQPVIKTTYVPVYPIEAYREGIEGKVLVEVSLNARGEVEAVKVIDSPDERFNASAIYAAERFTFEPATRDGKAVAIRFRMNISYTLDKAVIEETCADAHEQIMTTFRPNLPFNRMWFHDGEKIVLNLDFVVNKEGRVSFIHLNEYTNEGFAAAVVNELLEQKFTPAMIDGHPISVMIRMEDIKVTGRINWL